MGDGIKTLSHELIDAFPAGPFDLLAAYGERIPVIVISRMLGVPEDMAGQLLAWSHAMVAMYQAGRSRETEDAAVRATLDFSDFMRAHIETRRKNPGNDIISTLIAAGE
ncbi:MAG: cytochrome P450, partial [Paracoccaceae bacterium]